MIIFVFCLPLDRALICLAVASYFSKLSLSGAQ
uniref:Uncharacterized protein n=1 Tax=Anguilla anguilla TaxID=7936 RepID=A0A0E9SEM2_ANGAN